MDNVKYFALAVATVFIYTACTKDALANNADATKSAEKTAPAGPPKDVLVILEKSAYAAWKSKDAKFWDTFLSDKFVGWGTSGKLDKVSAKKEYAGADCDIKSYALSEERVSPRGKQAALITYKATVDGTCGGQKIPTNSWVAGVYVRDGGQWKAVFHAQDAVVNPELSQVKPVYQNGAGGNGTAKPAAPDAGTGTLLAIEGAVWEAWKDHDAKRLSDLMAEDISFINIFGIYLPNKAEGLKNWSGAGCDVKSVAVTDATATMLSPDVGILTFKATANGTCFGQEVGPIWGTSIYVKYGDAWKWTFGINVPARGEST
jgi:ketosteroid isomerase-like protein